MVTDTVRWAIIVALLRWTCFWSLCCAGLAFGRSAALDLLLVALLRCATAYGVRKKFFPSLTRHLPFSSQARLGTVPGYYQPSRCAGLDQRTSHIFLSPEESALLRVARDVGSFVLKRIRCSAVSGVESHPSQKRRRMGHPRFDELKKKRGRWAPS